MNRIRALTVSVAVALVAVTGAFALSDTLAVGNQANATTDQEVAKRTAQLNSYEASLRKALAEQPPVLPAVPRAATTGASGQFAAGIPPRVIYHRPPPIVVTDQHAGEEDESEQGDREHEDKDHEDSEHEEDDADD